MHRQSQPLLIANSRVVVDVSWHHEIFHKPCPGGPPAGTICLKSRDQVSQGVKDERKDITPIGISVSLFPSLFLPVPDGQFFYLYVSSSAKLELQTKQSYWIY